MKLTWIEKAALAFSAVAVAIQLAFMGACVYAVYLVIRHFL